MTDDSPSSDLTGRRVLLAGESWITQGTHTKGVVAYSTGSYEEGGAPLIEALEQAGAVVEYLPNHLAAERFPREADDLARFSAVVLSDIASDTLLLDHACFVEGVRSVNRLELLTRYVELGGGLLMVGGYMSFAGMEGKAHYASTPVARVLPVIVSGSDDRRETPEGVTPMVRRRDHAILRGIDGEWPYLLGYNRLAQKPDTDLLLAVGEDPLLCVCEAGAGRAAAFASDCSPHWGSRAFIGWRHYGRFWSQLVGWVSAAEVSG